MTRIDIEFSVERQNLTLITKEPLRAKDENYFYAVFNLCEKWSDVNGIKASFVRDDLSFVVELTQGANGYLECNIPWELMTDKGEFYVGIFGGDRILTNTVRIDVAESCLSDGAAPQPPTPDWFTKMEDKIENFQPSKDVMDAAINNYLTEHPIQSGATEEQAAQIEANKQAISDIQNAGYITSIPDEYAKKTDVAAAVSDKVTTEQLNAAIADFVTESEVDQKISAIPTQDLSKYALKTDIPDVSGFITEIPSEYVTETELNAKGYLTEHQSLENYATKDYVSNALAPYAKTEDIPDVSGFLTEIPSEYITESELNAKGYATTEQIPDVSAYQTQEQVIALIQQYGGGGGESLPVSEEAEF